MALDFSPSELILIRHGATAVPDRLAGHTDVGLSDTQPDALPSLVKTLAPIDQVIASPAQRCVQTAELIWGQGDWPQDARLWEQDFGAWENIPHAELPDIGDLDQDALARHRPPQGESFLDVCARVEPALKDAAAQAAKGRPLAIVAHAGVIRAALAMALGNPAHCLLFEVAPLSITRLRCLPDARFSIIATNWHPA
ncbi:MAG: histidine phosphatase family protein [Silicimonas sp.]|nr:histidine phosphatase family protein [Silicimonas sp.]